MTIKLCISSRFTKAETNEPRLKNQKRGLYF